MTKKGYTHCSMILDRSGSMMGVRSDVIGGINQFLKEQRELPGECTFTLVQFDSQNSYEILVDFQPIKNVKDIGNEYAPRGNTPLYDAVGRGIVNLGERLADLSESQRPEKVVFVTMTDGLENSSTEYDAVKVSKMTKEQEEKWNWKFVYLGSKHDAVASAAGIGIKRSSSAQYSEERTGGGILMTSAKLAAYRSAGGTATVMDFTDEDRKSLR